jgi:hypothetical protein
LKTEDKYVTKTSALASVRAYTTVEKKYVLSRENRGLFGVIYGSNSSVGSGQFGTINTGTANCYCFTPGKTDVNMMIIDDNGVFMKFEEPVLTCELSVMSLQLDSKIDDEYLWEYSWDRTDYTKSARCDPSKPLKLNKLSQLEVA